MARVHQRRGAVAAAALSCLVAPFLSGASCLGIGAITDTAQDITRQTVGVLDDAIGTLAQQSSQWQVVLAQTRDKLVADAQSTVRTEIQNLLDRSIASASGEIRCDIDFIGARVRQALEHIRAELLNQPGPSIEPALCNVVPPAIDMALSGERRNKLEFFGYDLDKMPISVTLHNTSGDVDVSDKLSRSTHYHALLNLGVNGVPLGPDSQRIQLKWGGHEGSTIVVIQPGLPVCTTEVISPPAPNEFAYIPLFGGGDRDYDGHGPDVNISVGLFILDEQVRAVVNMSARETRSDWTDASGITFTTLYTVDPGKRIDAIVGSTYDEFSYRDSDHAPDEFSRGNGPVQKYVFVGDTSGDEAGTETGVVIHWNPLRLMVSQTGNCVPAPALFSARKADVLGPGHEEQLRALERLEGDLEKIKRPMPILRPR